MELNKHQARCTLATGDTEVSRRVGNASWTAEYSLGEAIAGAIHAFDAANPVTPGSSGTTLADRVRALLTPKPSRKGDPCPSS